MNRKELNQIEFCDKEVLGKGLSCVFPGIFKKKKKNQSKNHPSTSIPCAVKRVTSEKADKISEDNVRSEIKIWKEWSNQRNKEGRLPIVQFYCYERDKNEDFWLKFH